MRRTVFYLVLLGSLLWGSWAPQRASAAPAPSEPAGQTGQELQAAQDGYEPVSGDMISRGETIPAKRLVAAAYGFIFLALLVYVTSVAARMRRVDDEISELKRQLERRTQSGGQTES